MELFKKKKSTDEKFEEDQKRKVIMTLLRIYRDDKFKIPRTESGDKLIELCNSWDPDKKMSEEQLVSRLIDSDEIHEFIKSINTDNILPDDCIKACAEKYYLSLIEVLQSPDSKAWDTHEFQSQQLISVMSLNNFNKFKNFLKQAMDADPKCPWFVKTQLISLLMGPKNVPTKEDEDTAEEIMNMVCTGLKMHSPEVFRALVDSLKWRGRTDLQRTLEAVKKTPPEKRKLKGRESCLFIESDDTVHYVG